MVNKLDKKNVENLMELTSLQHGILFHYISDELSTEYHEQLSLTIKGNIKVDLIKRAWNLVIENNEILRTVFRWKEIDKPIQIVLKEHQIKIENLDFTNEKDKNKAVENVKLMDLNNRIDITKETVRVYLCKLEDYKYEMIISNHHILYDGWSNGIILKELMQAYTCLYKGKELNNFTKTKFSEFIKYINNLNKDNQRNYWTNYLQNLDSRGDWFDSVEDSSTLKQISHKINETKADKIKEFAKKNKISLSSILYGVWGVLIQKLSNTEDVIFGTTVSGRPENIKLVDNIVGLFINTIPLRIKSDKDVTFIELIKNTDCTMNERKDFENTPLVDIKEYCGIKANEEFFNSIVTIENYPLDLNLNKNNILSIEDFSIIEKTNYNMDLEILTFDGIEFKFNYRDKSINENTAQKLGIYLERIIDTLYDCPNIKLSEIEILTEKEKHQILYEFNDTKAEYPKDKTIQELFEEQVEKTPDNIAVVFEDKKLTYKELNEKANSLARLLRSKGVQPDTIIGIMVERSLEMIIGIMGILKAGGAYLPIDSNYPKKRIEYVLNDSESKILLSTEELMNNIEYNGEFINLYMKDIFEGNSRNLEIINNSNNLAYVIYTSGTTGKPKGVMIEHKPLVNRLNWMQKKYPLNENDMILQKTTFTFDVSVWEIFWWSLIGAKVCMLTHNNEKDPLKIIEAINKYNITTMHFVPSMLNSFLYYIEENQKDVELPSLRQVFCSGEPLNYKQVIKFYKKFNLSKKLINLYGPTEATIDVSYFECNNNVIKSVPIGKPIDNIKLYILNKNKLMPIGVSGELCISGDGLARGYLNRPELTKEKFVDNPFEIGTKMYKTGDLARWIPDGNIEFLGRIDNQVKLRGFRIELGEIESILLGHVDVKETVVLSRENKYSDKYLCAYVVSEKKISELDLKSHLKKSLPKYMIPSYFVQVDKMPVTTNGKLNRKALPKPNLDVILNEYEAPRNEIEEKLSKIWSEVLGVKRVGINDDFFDLGGHSLKATVLISKIHKELNKEIPLKELFKKPTIKDLSKLIKNTEDNLYLRIEKVEERKYYEASSSQKRMYMIQQFNEDSVAYNMPVVFELEGEIDKQRIEETFKKLVIRHEALRTYFQTIDGEIVQKIDNSYQFKLIDKKDNEEIDTIINNFIKPFDLSKAPLFSVELVESKEKKYLLIDMHHIISDGVSANILTNDFVTLYKGEELEPLNLQYKDFAAWQNNFLKSEEMKKQEEYWIKRFSDEIPVLNMPTDYERPVIQNFEGNSLSFKVNEETTEKLRKLAKEIGSTMYMVLLSAFNILLSKYSGQEDIIIGTPIAGRPHAELENIMGMFVNTLALRNKPERRKKYLEFLNDVKENSLKAYENQSYQFETLVEKLDIVRDTSRNPLFDVMFNLIDTEDSDDIDLDGLILKQYSKENKISKFDLTLNALEKDKILEFSLEYCTKLFNKEDIERISKHYIRVLENIINNKEIKINEIEILTEEEKHQILYKFNDTKADYPKDKTIQELFEEQVEKTPDNTAVVFEDKKLTYRELNEKANQLARVLRSKGVQPDTIIGIMVGRSLEMIIGIMGILKAGGAYLPIDPNYPKKRIEYMLKDSESKVLLSKNSIADTIEFEGRIIDIYDEEYLKEDTRNLDIINSSNDLAYVIYTSGTTGEPKGVMIEHKGIINLKVYYEKEYEITKHDNIVQFASCSFDAAVSEVNMALLIGGSLYIVSKEIISDLNKFEEFINTKNITIVTLPPIYATNLRTVKINSLRILLTAGSKTNFYLVNRWKNKVKYINAYGPTETTICATDWKYDKDNYTDRLIPIGKPIYNTQIYIVNDNQIMPIGIPGEICISGDGLARGYINRPELTKEKFVENPFNPGKKMYKTGDLARWLPDGNIEFLGRIDNQVKIRGFRIELGEIENRLLNHEDINEAAVLVKEGKYNDKYLCAYVVSEKEITKLNLKGYLEESLPEYMVPSYFIQLQKMPLTANGKLNRKALPEPNLECNLNEYEAPRNKVEEKLTEIWSEVLGVKRVGISDNFFDLGGHSLKATVLISKIHKELNKEISLKELFKKPTIKDLSKLIKNTEDNPFSKIEKVEEKEYYEVSSAQKRMYMLQEFDKDSVAYNTPGAFGLEGKINKQRIEKTFKKLVMRHETLRTYFEIIDGEIVQKIDNSYEFKLIDRKDNEEIDTIINNFIKPFDLSKAPLFRVELVESKEKKYLLIDMHHIMSDGVSANILKNEFITLYKGEELKSLSLQYKDFAAWQNNFLKSEEIKKQENYWLGIYNEKVKILSLPYDNNVKTENFDGGDVNFVINKGLTKKILEINKNVGCTLNNFLFTILNILLLKYTMKNDIVIGIPVMGRQHADTMSIVGVFINTLAIRSRIDANKTFIDFLRYENNNLIEAYENQSYPLEKLVSKINIERNKGINSIFNIIFNMTEVQDKIDTYYINNIGFKKYNRKNHKSKFDLSFNATHLQNSNKIICSFSYKISLFNKNTIIKMSSNFINIIKFVLINRNVILHEINIFSPEEKKEILSKIERNIKQENIKINNLAKITCAKRSINNGLEQKILKIWKDVLNVEAFGVNDNFFEFGGDSLKVIKVINQMKKVIGIKVYMPQIFENNTVRLMSKCLSDDIWLKSNIGPKYLTLLNEKRETNLFGIAPISSFGLAYKDIAHLIYKCSFYALDYIENDNRIDQYINIIKSVQPSGPYILLGWSAGGLIAYDIAKKMEYNGDYISNIILLDSVPLSKDQKDKYEELLSTPDVFLLADLIHKKNIRTKELEIQIDDLKLEKENTKEFLDRYQDKDEKSRYFKRIYEYNKFINEINSIGKINAKIHLLQVLRVKDNKINIFAQKGWRKLTKNSVIKYNCYGTHFDMLDKYALQNARIVNKIIDNILN